MPYSFAPETSHDDLVRRTPRELAFRPGVDLSPWRRAVDGRLRQLLGDTPSRVDPDLRVDSFTEHDGWTETRFVIAVEDNAHAPCHLLMPKESAYAVGGRVPVVICVQGHSSGMHISLGRPQREGDQKSIAGDRDFAVQAVRRGYAAVIIEQRCFGEREDRRPDNVAFFRRRCHHASMVALLLGRTMVGERCWDVSRLIDVLPRFDGLDLGRLGIMGNSTGGTISYFAACLDDRIRISMPSCYVCTYAHSLGYFDHCECNYIPAFLKYFDLEDLSCLIAPRPLVVVAGATDRVFPLDGVRIAFERISEIYHAAGAAGACRLIIGSEGHRFYADAAWPVFDELARWSETMVG